jgi:acyl-CoA synthetase (AMP-forming)/AMP-acid ligase II/acyl carrier protein
MISPRLMKVLSSHLLGMADRTCAANREEIFRVVADRVALNPSAHDAFSRWKAAARAPDLQTAFYSRLKSLLARDSTFADRVVEVLRRDDPAAGASTLVEMLRLRALHEPDARSHIFLADGKNEGPSLTYQQFDAQARSIGALLQDLASRGDRVLLLYPAGLEFLTAFFGCLYAGCVAVSLDLPRLGRWRSQLDPIINDAAPTLALTTSALLPIVQQELVHALRQQGLRCVASDSVSSDLAERWREPAMNSATTAYLQYTSGSTALPKGVVLSHGNILAETGYMDYGAELCSTSVMVSWLPHFHDMGLVFSLIQPLYNGFPCFFMSPYSFLKEPVRWLNAISRFRGTHSGGPDSGYALCVRKVTPQDRANLDLSSWTCAFNGSEPVREKTLTDFARLFGPCRFDPDALYPAYGLAEGTLEVSGSPRLKTGFARCSFHRPGLEEGRVVETEAGQPDSVTMVSCGRTRLDTEVAIVDPAWRQLCPPDRLGEIWVSGPCVAQGYWHRPAETQATFAASLARSGAGTYLRTGDLGFLKNGELFIAGRLKDVLIIRGRNYFPQDIELTVERSHAALRGGFGAAFPFDTGTEETLVVVHELRRDCPNPDVDAVIRAVLAAVAEEHDVHVHAIALAVPGTLPKTTSGKIQRRSCRRAFSAGQLDLVAFWRSSPGIAARPTTAAKRVAVATDVSSIEALIVEIVASKMEVAADSIEPSEAFASLGLDSLAAVEMTKELQEWLGNRVELEPVTVWYYPTPEKLARHLAGELARSGEAAGTVLSLTREG